VPNRPLTPHTTVSLRDNPGPSLELARPVSGGSPHPAPTPEGVPTAPGPSPGRPTTKPNNAPHDAPANEGGYSLTELLARLAKLIRPHWVMAAPVIFGFAAQMSYEMFGPILIAGVFDVAIPQRDTGKLLEVMIGLGGLLALYGSGSSMNAWLISRLSAAVGRELRTDLFAHLTRLPLSFYQNTTTGEVIGRFASDVTAIEGVLLRSLPVTILGTLNATGCLMLLFYVEWRLAILTLVALPLAFLGGKLFGGRASAMSFARGDREAELSDTLQESLDNQTTIQAYGLQPVMRRSFGERVTDLFQSAFRSGFFSLLVGASTNAGINLVAVLVVSAGAFLALQGHFTVGALVGFLTLLDNLGEATKDLAQAVPEFFQATGAMKRIDLFLAEPVRETPATSNEMAPSLSTGLSFDNVSFRYGSDQPLTVDAVSFNVPKGEFCTLVGSSGSGRSTLVSLLTRMHSPVSGRIRWDGYDVETFSPEGLRGRIATVEQETHIFKLSLRDNIRLGRLTASDAKIEEAAARAGLNPFIDRLPARLDTPMGDLRLTYEQRQRIGFARAILRDPDVLILDAATLALDPGAERALNAAIREFGHGRTVLTITHRLNALGDTDRVVVMDNGRVAQIGTHSLLQKIPGPYRDLWNKQSGFTLSSTGDSATVSAERLKAIPVLADLDMPTLERLARQFQTETVAMGQKVIQQGEPGHKFYIMVRGDVDVVRGDGTGREVLVARLQDGDHFGEIALLENRPRTATLWARSTCTFLTLERAAFEQLVGENQFLVKKFAELAAMRNAPAQPAVPAPLRNRSTPG
jgi:ATP-binding cassette, subfamily B, bacterial